MKAKTVRALLLCQVLLLFAAHASARQQGAAPGDLAGAYSISSRFAGSALTLDADGRYAKESGDCTTDYHESGTFILSEGVLRFTILKHTARPGRNEKVVNLLDPSERKELYGDDDDVRTEFIMLPVRWSGRIYLIEEASLGDFANAVNLGLEPRDSLSAESYYGSFYLRDGDEEKGVKGKPNLPDKWLSFLLDKPVTATVVNVEGDAQDRVAIIDKGAEDGLRVGMRLVAGDEEPSPWSGPKVLSVEEKSARVRVPPALKVGDGLTTKYERKDIDR